MTKPLPIRTCCLLYTFRSGRATIRVKRLKLQGTDPSLTPFFYWWKRFVLEELFTPIPSWKKWVLTTRHEMNTERLNVSTLQCGRDFLAWKVSTEMEWQKRPYHLTGHLVLLTSHPLSSSGGYIKVAVYLDVRSPLCQNLLGGNEMLRLQLPPPQKKNVWNELEYSQFTCRATGRALTENL